MGMFDYVDVPEPVHCPTCGAALQFQTKDSDFPMLERVDFRGLTNFYAWCGCKTWVEYTRTLPPATSLADFTVTVERNTVEGE